MPASAEPTVDSCPRCLSLACRGLDPASPGGGGGGGGGGAPRPRAGSLMCQTLHVLLVGATDGRPCLRYSNLACCGLVYAS